MAADPLTSNTVGELLNYDVSDGDDPFANVPLNKTRDDKTTLSPRAVKRRFDDDKENFGLGLDEEVKIVKKRKPVAKLDEARLLSQPGIPKLRALANSGHIAQKLRLKGKGHEFTDAGRLLNYYQLWLDNLYPRAKFADGLQLVEKVGHSKNMQRLRRDWIDEGKPGYLRERMTRKSSEPQDRVGSSMATRDAVEQQATSKGPLISSAADGLDDEDMFFPDSHAQPARHEEDAPEDDELEALLAEQSHPRPLTLKKVEPDSEGEDDPDALLAEHESRRKLDSRTDLGPKGQSTFEHLEEDDQDDLDGLLAEQESRQQEDRPRLPSDHTAPAYSGGNGALGSETHAIILSSPIDNDLMDDDDPDALLTEQEAREQDSADAGLLPAMSKSKSPGKQEESQGQESAVFFSSSPIPNDELDDAEL